MEELLVIEAEGVTVILKGKLDTKKHRSASGEVFMQLGLPVGVEISVFDRDVEALVSYQGQQLRPIFFENGRYELLIVPDEQDKATYTFDHEYESFRKAVTPVSRSRILTGVLHFQSEVGLSELHVLRDGQPHVTFTIEVFPTKLDYQQDYKALLDEVNGEIYNLAYSFIQPTHLKASRKQFKDPTFIEFYRLLEQHVEDYELALRQVERFPHHQLVTSYEEVRGERLRRQDNRGRAYLRKNARHFVEVGNGILIGEKTMLPTKGLLLKKQHTYDTHENRYVKWTMKRIISRVTQLIKKVKQLKKEQDESVRLLERIEAKLQKQLQKPFWRTIGELDRSVYSLVLQMGTGYRDIFKVYTVLSQSLVLHGDLYKMSVKNIATLYEYWTFLKLGQILHNKAKPLSQDVVKVRSNGLYLNLQADQAAERIFKHPVTEERIVLRYQYHSKRELPTTIQKPDSMLSIEKHGRDYMFQYIFDAKYRVHFEKMAGPQQDDINTMHRYRDAIVAEQNGIYERTAFGAYVLFPWNDETEYRNHPLFESIQKVNIGGLPFLPNHTSLVEEVLDNLLNKSAEELQREGVLPRGARAVLSGEMGTALVVPAELQGDVVQLPFDILPQGAESVQQMALADQEGIRAVVDVVSRERKDDSMLYYVTNLQQDSKSTVAYYVDQPFIVKTASLKLARTLKETVIETKLLRVLHRLRDKVSLELNETAMNANSRLQWIEIDAVKIEVFEDRLVVQDQSILLEATEKELFEWIVEHSKKS